MPVITFEGAEMATQMKKELIQRLTKTSAEITGIPDQFFTVVVREQPAENLGVGGETVAEIKKRLAKAQENKGA